MIRKMYRSRRLKGGRGLIFYGDEVEDDKFNRDPAAIMILIDTYALIR